MANPLPLTAMGIDLHANIMPLQDLLGTYAQSFKIPDNQRAFVWDKQEFAILLDDLTANLLEGKRSFLGTICLSQDNGSWLIVDGQQRITTFSCLLLVLMSRLHQNQQQKQAKLPGWCWERVRKSDASGTCEKISLLLSQHPYSLDQQLLDYVWNYVDFAVLEVPLDEYHRIYDSINSGGKPLEIQELVYNDLYNRKDPDLQKNWAKFLSLMTGTAEIGSLQSFTNHQTVLNTPDNTDTDQDDADSSDIEPEDSFEHTENPPSPGAAQDAQNTKKEIFFHKQQNFRNFFKAFTRMDCNTRLPADLFRSMELRLDNLALKQTSLSNELLCCAQYYALLVSPIEHFEETWFTERFPNAGAAFLCALTRFSTLHLGDALPLLMRLMRNKETDEATLTAYMDGIFWLYLLADISRSRSLRQNIRARLPGLDQQVHARLKGSVINSNEVQITLIGSRKLAYEAALENLPMKLRKLRWQGNASRITSLLVAHLLEVTPFASKDECIQQLKSIWQKGSFSVEHLSPQSKKDIHNRQAVGNLALVEKHINSKASDHNIVTKLSIYQDSALLLPLYQAAVELYGDAVDPEISKEDLTANIDARTELVCTAWKGLFPVVTPVDPEPQKNLLFLEENLNGNQTWTWAWIDPNAYDSKVVYHHDNAKKNNNQTILSICDPTDDDLKTAKTMENPQHVDLIGHPFLMLYESVKALSGNTVSPAEFCHALRNCGDILKTAGISLSSGPNSVSIEFSTITSDGKTLKETLPLYYKFPTDYRYKFTDCFQQLFNEMGFTPQQQETLNKPIYLRLRKPEFHACNDNHYSHLVYLWGPRSIYMAKVKDEEKAYRAQSVNQQTNLNNIQTPPTDPFISSQIFTLQTLADTLDKNNQTLYIPTYQRSYVWNTTQWDALKESFQNALPRPLSPGTAIPTKSRFLGILLLGEITDQNNQVTGYELIDGQQRLSTLACLFPKLGLQDKMHFVEANKTLADLIKDGSDRYKALQAYADTNKDSLDLLEKMPDCLSFLVLILHSADRSRANELFSTINGRGRHLTPGEIIKNHILSNPLKFQNTDKETAYYTQAKKMWQDHKRFELFLKVYTDMHQGDTVSKLDLVSTIKEQDESFLKEMVTYWKYYELLWPTKEKKTSKPKIDDLATQYELYLHWLAGTHTTLPPLLYLYHNLTQSLKQLSVQQKNRLIQPADYLDRTSNLMRQFRTVLQQLTDAFLLCHICGYDNALKSMDKRMAGLVKTWRKSNTTLPAAETALSFKQVTGVDISLEELQSSLEEGFRQDLYHKSQSRALLLVCRCEQALYAQPSSFYKQLLNSLGSKSKPSVEHVHPQANKKAEVDYIWNYILLENDLNIKAKDHPFSEKQKEYQLSKYRLPRALAMRSAKDYPPEHDLKAAMTAALTGIHGLTHVRPSSNTFTNVPSNTSSNASSNTSSGETQRNGVTNSHIPTKPVSPPISTAANHTTSQATLLQLNPGDMVEHATFGKGKVLNLRPMGDDALVEVAFDQVGSKKLMLKSASVHMKKL